MRLGFLGHAGAGAGLATPFSVGLDERDGAQRVWTEGCGTGARHAVVPRPLLRCGSSSQLGLELGNHLVLVALPLDAGASQALLLQLERCLEARNLQAQLRAVLVTGRLPQTLQLLLKDLVCVDAVGLEASIGSAQLADLPPQLRLFLILQPTLRAPLPKFGHQRVQLFLHSPSVVSRSRRVRDTGLRTRGLAPRLALPHTGAQQRRGARGEKKREYARPLGGTEVGLDGGRTGQR